MAEYIKAENVTYSYCNADNHTKHMVLQDLNLSVEEGSFVVLLGPNGSGKSTFAKHLNGVLLPEGGKVFVGGMDTADEKLLLEIRRRTGMVFQNPDNQIVASVVEEDVAFAPENLGCPPEEIRRRVDEALQMVGMYEYRNYAPHLLSGGQKQRIAIAGVLAMGPKCIVFDEPTAMLDPKGRADVVQIIEKLSREKHCTVIFITHHMEEAIHADRVVILKKGRVLLDGTPNEIFGQVDTMKDLGLTVPPTTEILYRLQKEGLAVTPEALSTKECAASIYAALQESEASPERDTLA